MGELVQIPKPMSQDEFVAVMEDVLARIKEGDSFEGFIEYLMPTEGDPEDAAFMVRARYRIGNTMGQGGMRFIPDLTPKEAEGGKPDG